MKFEIKNRWTGAVQFERELGAEFETEEFRVRLGAAVKLAIKARADLARADLTGADLTGANLAGANLAGANLARADLTGANLAFANLAGANLAGANLAGADLAFANLAGANLAGANLARADLDRADLDRADLSGADLRSGANLRGAYLRGAKGITLAQSSPLALLKYQRGPIRAFKVVNNRYEGIHQGGVPYLVGTEVISEASTDPFEHCAAGVNVASLDWCLREYNESYRILIVEFTATDIASIPLGTDGKFRLHRCRVICEMPRDEIRRALGKAWSDASSGWAADYELSASGDALDHIRRYGR